MMRTNYSPVLAGGAVLGAVAGVLALWYFAAELVHWRAGKFDASGVGALGSFGDVYGAINALFSGLAFLAVALSLLIMMRQISATQRQIIATAAPLLIAEIREAGSTFTASQGGCHLRLRIGPKNLSGDPALTCSYKAEWLAGATVLAKCNGAFSWPIVQDTEESLPPQVREIVLRTEPRRLSAYARTLNFTRERLMVESSGGSVRLRLTLAYKNTHGQPLSTTTEFAILFGDRAKGNEIATFLEQLPGNLPSDIQSRLEMLPLDESFSYDRPHL